MCFSNRKKEKMVLVLGKLCEILVDVIQEKFTKKILYCQDIPIKERPHLINSEKKRGMLLYEEKEAFHSKIFTWYCKRHSHLDKKYILNLMLIKECSGYDFHYFLISRDIYILIKNNDEIYFCPRTLEFSLRLRERGKKTFNFIYPFRSVYYSVNQTVFTICYNCQDLVDLYCKIF